MESVKVTRKAKKGPVPARLFFILARQAPIGLVFRRGPSKWVQLVKWHTKTDIFEPGQWFHGRIHERRCDLSPDGSLLIYFAHKISAKSLRDKEYTYAWTAISKPPFLTALALWPKGDCWHGGGSFIDGYTVLLNHRPEVARPHPKHRPHGLRVLPNPHANGEDDPIFPQRLERDGWKEIQAWKVENRDYPQLCHTIEPEIRERISPSGRDRILLTRSIECLDYSEEFAVGSIGQSELVNIDQASWADFDQQGRLVFAKDGKVFAGEVDEQNRISEKLLIDLNPLKPCTLRTPKWATEW
jgi:hypothetical protein